MSARRCRCSGVQLCILFVNWRPVRRYETSPGGHMQIDWREFRYEQNDHLRKVYGFTAILGYSRMRFVCFTKCCDTPSLIRCLMLACEYVDGLPQAILTDRMKRVLVAMRRGTSAGSAPAVLVRCSGGAIDRPACGVPADARGFPRGRRSVPISPAVCGPLRPLPKRNRSP